VWWVLDSLDDLESDFSVFHRVEDMYALPTPKFFRLASRLFAYEGVLRRRLISETQHQHEEQEPAVQHRPDEQVIPPTQAAIMSSALADVVSFGQG
jgi:hypothetical protein